MFQPCSTFSGIPRQNCRPFAIRGITGLEDPSQPIRVVLNRELWVIYQCYPQVLLLNVPAQFIPGASWCNIFQPYCCSIGKSSSRLWFIRIYGVLLGKKKNSWVGLEMFPWMLCPSIGFGPHPSIEKPMGKGHLWPMMWVWTSEQCSKTSVIPLVVGSRRFQNGFWSFPIYCVLINQQGIEHCSSIISFRPLKNPMSVIVSIIRYSMSSHNEFTQDHRFI